MATHSLDASPDVMVDVFDRETPPVLQIDPGDTVVVHTLDAVGYIERQRTPGEDRPKAFAAPRGHCLSGPIEIHGAEPGNVLAVQLNSIRPGEWGWTIAGAMDNKLNRHLGVTDHPPVWLLWEVDADAGTATNHLGHTVGIAPFLGVIGLPPDEPGSHSTVPPRTLGGGNIDCRDLVAGSTLYLPVTVPGAMLHVGDGHAAQGHGEVCGTAIECPMTTSLTLDILTTAPISGIHAVTPTARLTFGFDEDLNTATAVALDGMVQWIQVLHELDKSTALALASSTVDLYITQVANETWGAHAALPHNAIR